MYIAEQRTEHYETDIVAERRQIARDLHDGVAQQFAHVLHKLAFIERLLEMQEDQLPSSPQLRVIHDEIQLAYELQKATLNELRNYMMALLPATPVPTIPSAPVGTTTFMTPNHEPHATPLSLFIEQFRQQNSHIELTYVDEYTHDMTTALLVPVFRVVQEALHNVRKHAQASHVTVRVCLLSHNCIVEVIDDGVGFQTDANNAASSNGLGLHIMRDRTQEAGGEWAVYSAPGKGTTIRARFPL